MHRVLGLLLFSVLALAGYLLFSGPLSAPAGGGAGPLQGYAGSVVGLIVGLLLAWLVALDWRTLPERACAWVRVQRYRLGWVLLGGCCACILLLF
jgi:hypothetical protein